jgi:hypothetical protein
VQVTIPGEILERNLSDTHLNRDFRRVHPGQAQMQKPQVDQVIDLTDAALADAPDLSDARHVREPASLPTRSPGEALGEAMAASRSVAEGESAVGIQAALAAYDQGRRAARQDVPDDPADDVLEENHE